MSVSNPLLVSFQYLSLGLCMNDSDRFGFSGSALRGNALQTGRCSFHSCGYHVCGGGGSLTFIR